MRVNVHTSNNQANILIKLCVHPNIISKSIDQKVFLKVITWSGYKRIAICGIIEIKRPIIEEHSLYQQLKPIAFPTNHYKPLVINNLSNNLDNLFCFLFFFLFLLFFFKFTNFDTSNIYTITCCQVTLTIHHDTWHKMPPFLLNLNTTKLWLNIPLS